MLSIKFQVSEQNLFQGKFFHKIGHFDQKMIIIGTHLLKFLKKYCPHFVEIILVIFSGGGVATKGNTVKGARTIFEKKLAMALFLKNFHDLTFRNHRFGLMLRPIDLHRISFINLQIGTNATRIIF